MINLKYTDPQDSKVKNINFKNVEKFRLFLKSINNGLNKDTFRLNERGLE
jgi:hypothetical protein